MSVCPHCGKDMSPRAPSPWWKYDPGPTANLGCGTLILIAIVVAAVSSRGTDSVVQLQQQVRALEEKIDGLSKGIEKLRHPSQLRS